MAGAEPFGLTPPLLATNSAAKMGKPAAGAVWLSPGRLAPYDYWQYWRNTEDADVGRFLLLFTEMPAEEARRLGALRGAEINEAKKVLATEATALLHGRAAAEEAADTARRAFEAGEAAETLPGIEAALPRSEEHTSEIQSRQYLVCRLLLEKKKNKNITEHQLSKQ